MSEYGWCGSKQHEPHSQAFKDCMKAAHRVMSDSPGDLLRLPTPAVADGPESDASVLENAFKFNRLHYDSSHLIDSNIHLDLNEVQMYLDGDDDLYDLVYEDPSITTLTNASMAYSKRLASILSTSTTMIEMR